MMPGYYGHEYLECLKAEKFILNSDFTIIQQFIRVKNTLENLDWIYQMSTDQ